MFKLKLDKEERKSVDYVIRPIIIFSIIAFIMTIVSEYNLQDSTNVANTYQCSIIILILANVINIAYIEYRDAKTEKYFKKYIEKRNIQYKLAISIVEEFECLLDEKGIDIPCKDEDEQKERYDGDNDAKLYGIEYYDLVDNVNKLLDEYTDSMSRGDYYES